MKKGRKSWMTKLPPDTLSRFEAMCLERNRSAKDIFVALDLLRFARFETVRHAVSEIRAQNKSAGGMVSPEASDGPAGQPPSSPSSSAESLEALERQTIETALNGVVAGTVKVSTCASLLIAISALKGSRVREKSDDRAEDKHKVWMREKTAALKTAVDERTEDGAKPISRADVYDLVDQVMRGKA